MSPANEYRVRREIEDLVPKAAAEIAAHMPLILCEDHKYLSGRSGSPHFFYCNLRESVAFCYLSEPS